MKAIETMSKNVVFVLLAISIISILFQPGVTFAKDRMQGRAISNGQFQKEFSDTVGSTSTIKGGFTFLLTIFSWLGDFDPFTHDPFTHDPFTHDPFTH